MKTSTFIRTLCAAALVAAWAQPLHAAIIEGTLRFEAWGFGAVNSDGTPSSSAAPVSPVTGVVRYRFDNAAGFLHQTDGALVNGGVIEVSAWDLNIPWNGVLAVSYLKAPPNPLGVFDTLAFSQGPTTAVDFGEDDWRLMVSAISDEPSFLQFWYSPAGGQIAYGPASGIVRAVPEPSTGGLLLAGLCGMAGLNAVLRRRGKRVDAPGESGRSHLPQPGRTQAGIRRPLRRLPTAFAPAAMALALAACGGGGGDGDGGNGSDTTGTDVAAWPTSDEIAGVAPGGMLAGNLICAAGTFQYRTSPDGTRRLTSVSSLTAPRLATDSRLSIRYQTTSLQLDVNGFGGPTFGPADERAPLFGDYRYFVRGTSEFEIGPSSSLGDAALGRYSDEAALCFFAVGSDRRPLVSGSDHTFYGFADGLALLGGVARRLYPDSKAHGTINFRGELELTLNLTVRESPFQQPANPMTLGPATGRLDIAPTGAISGVLTGPGGSSGTVAGSLFEYGVGVGLVFELGYPNGDHIYGAIAADLRQI